MKIDQTQLIQSMIELVENEGLEYTFCTYSSFLDIEDWTFHEVRTKFEEAVKQLNRYLMEMEEKLNEK